MPKNELVLKFDPHTIEHLGIKMYSQLPYALAELVANAYDAAADKVEIMLIDNSENKKIIVTDNGEGMSYKEIQDNFLIIGRKRRQQDCKRENVKGRKVTGRKGVGKLALFGIGTTIRIETSKSGDNQATVFVLDWNDIINETDGQYKPKVSFAKKCNPSSSGTTITLTGLTRVSSFNERDTAVSLSKLFNCFDEGFVVSVQRNDGSPVILTRELRYEGIDKQFEWDVASLANEINKSSAEKFNLKGTILASRKPMRQDLRGISLYANGRLANAAGFFGASEAGHTFTYISGWIDADSLDELDVDLISTDRQSLSWDLPETHELRELLQLMMKYLVKDWSSKRKKIKEKVDQERSGVNINAWTNTMPDDMGKAVKRIIEKAGKNPTVDDEEYSEVVNGLYKVMPEYPIFHWRNLHGTIQTASKEKYQNGDYYGALEEACKAYAQEVRHVAVLKEPSCSKTIRELNDRALMDKVFSEDMSKTILSVAANIKRPNNTSMDCKTLASLEAAQRSLSVGIITGYRNPLAHEQHKDLSITGVISEQHCLDALSLISLLTFRLDGAEAASSG